MSGTRRVVVFGVLLTLLLGGAYIARDAAAGPTTDSRSHCSGLMPLRPVETPGYLWEPHRHRLVGPAPFNRSRYAIVNVRTGIAYRWAFIRNAEGRALFGVSTRWVWLHPEWKDDPWLLMYDCA
jgi:hypothetical protein